MEKFKEYTVINNRTKVKNNYTSLQWNLAWWIVWVLGIIVGVILGIASTT